MSVLKCVYWPMCYFRAATAQRNYSLSCFVQVDRGGGGDEEELTCLVERLLVGFPLSELCMSNTAPVRRRQTDFSLWIC